MEEPAPASFHVRTGQLQRGSPGEADSPHPGRVGEMQSLQILLEAPPLWSPHASVCVRHLEQELGPQAARIHIHNPPPFPARASESEGLTLLQPLLYVSKGPTVERTSRGPAPF